MPFTFAHPAIVLPLGKIKYSSMSMSALIIGSITPDFEYFLRMKLTGRFSHTIEGMFLLDLPVSIAIALVFHLWVKKPLIDNLPAYFKSRLMTLKQFNFLKYLTGHYHVFIACLLIGIGSHILWDSFTHSKEYFVERIDFLSHPISIFGLPSIPMFRYLQHLSTLTGFVVIGFVFHGMKPMQCKDTVLKRFWFYILITALIGFSIRATLGFEYYGDVVATVISAVFIGLIVSCSIIRFSNG